ncbi:MAG: hypothetical protein Q9227_009216 [Pyrenula ochraceoflavens]
MARRKALQSISNNTATRKRRRTLSKRDNAAQKAQKTSDNVRKRRELSDQYYQGRSVLEFPGLGIGWYLLGTPYLPFQSPLSGQARIEVMSGMKNKGPGGIRICASDDYWPNEDPITQPIIMVPIQHIEQIIVLKNSAKSAPKYKAYQIVIVPTASTGSTPLLRKSPKIICFNWPDKKTDSHLRGTCGENADSRKDTYLSVFLEVFNEKLLALKKSVVCPHQEDENQPLKCNTTAIFANQRESEVGSTKVEATIVLVKDIAQDKKLVSIDIHIRTTESQYQMGIESRDGDTESMLLTFTKIPTESLVRVKEYMSNHSIGFEICEQLYYNFAKNQPATGPCPIQHGSSLPQFR